MSPRARARRLLGGLLSLLLVGLVVVPAGPAAAGVTPVGPEYFGVQDDKQKNASDTYGSARIWAAWCTVLPNAGNDPTARAQAVLGRSFTLNGLAGRNRLTVSLGHPPAWVFNNHKNAKKKAGIWYCGKHRAGIAFPSEKSLKKGRVRSLYAAYVTGVVKASKAYLEANQRNTVVLQAWNEPNLGSGGKINTKIRGAATSWTGAAKSLREQERIIRSVAEKLIPGRYEITTPSMYGKPTKLGTPYFKLQSKSRTVDSVSLNFYTLYVSTPNSSIKKWRKNAARATKVVRKYKSLRKVPIWITETNHNLVNSSKKTNLKATWTSDAAQRRLAEVTTLESIRLGFAGMQWYQGTAQQTAVDVRPGTTAALGIRRVRGQLSGRSLKSCGTKKSTAWCTFSAKKGSHAIKATWSTKGSAGVTFTPML